MKTNRNGNHKYLKTSQELQMLSSVTINCQLTKIVINPGVSIVSIVINVANVPMIAKYNIKIYIYLPKTPEGWKQKRKPQISIYQDLQMMSGVLIVS